MKLVSSLFQINYKSVRTPHQWTAFPKLKFCQNHTYQSPCLFTTPELIWFENTTENSGIAPNHNSNRFTIKISLMCEGSVATYKVLYIEHVVWYTHTH